MNAKTKNGLVILVMLSFLFCVVVLPAQAAQKPVADLSVTPTSGNVPLKVTFTDKSTGGKALWKWWGFGDGTGSDSTAKTVTHTYTKPGKYTVFLKVTNAAGTSTKTYPVPITVTTPTKKLKLSNKGIAFLKEHEGTHIDKKTGLHTMYEDSQGHCTVGYGHLVHKGGIDGRESETPYKNGITEAQATDLFKTDVAKYESAINDNVKVSLTQYQFDALVSFTYNIGIGGFKGSSALKELNKGNYDAVPSKMLLWNIPKEIIGRRTDEANLFKTGLY